MTPQHPAYDPPIIDEQSIPWSELVETLFRRRKIILGTIAAALAIVLVIDLLSPPHYKAKSRVLLTAQAIAGPREAAMPKGQIQAELARILNPSLTRSVLRAYHDAGHSPERDTAPIKRLKTAVAGFLRDVLETEAQAAQSRPGSLAGKLEASQIKGSNLIQVAYSGPDPRWAADFVNDLLRHHVESIAERSEAASAGSFYHNQRKLLAERWEQARAELSEFKNEHGAFLLEGDEPHLRQVLSAMESSRATTETQRLEAMAKIEFLTEEVEFYPETVAAESMMRENEVVQLLTSRILDLEIERSELLSRYTPTSTRVRNVERQIEQAERLLETKEKETLAEVKTVINPARAALELDLVQARTQLSALEARAEALDYQIDDYRYKLGRLEGISTELQRLEGEVTNAQKAYQQYWQKEEEARFTSEQHESGIVNVSIDTAAEVPRRPEPSTLPLWLALGLVTGLGLGVIIAFVRDWLDPSLKGSLQAHRLSGLPIIAELPAR